jgi:hypothetical protein
VRVDVQIRLARSGVHQTEFGGSSALSARLRRRYHRILLTLGPLPRDRSPEESISVRGEIVMPKQIVAPQQATCRVKNP